MEKVEFLRFGTRHVMFMTKKVFFHFFEIKFCENYEYTNWTRIIKLLFYSEYYVIIQIAGIKNFYTLEFSTIFYNFLESSYPSKYPSNYPSNYPSDYPSDYPNVNDNLYPIIYWILFYNVPLNVNIYVKILKNVKNFTLR